MTTLPKFLSRDKCRASVRKLNALMGEQFKAAPTKGPDGLWPVKFKGGVLSLKRNKK